MRILFRCSRIRRLNQVSTSWSQLCRTAEEDNRHWEGLLPILSRSDKACSLYHACNIGLIKQDRGSVVAPIKRTLCSVYMERIVEAFDRLHAMMWRSRWTLVALSRRSNVKYISECSNNLVYMPASSKTSTKPRFFGFTTSYLDRRVP